jgi:ornithine cyclodeaminase/alanine dehydrogenase-like protein (mu-crystallin family)
LQTTRTPHQLRVLADEDVAQMLPSDELRRSLQCAFRDHFDQYQSAPRIALSSAGNRSLIMTCHSGSLLGVKVVALMQVADRGPRVLRSTYSLYNGATGALLLIADADHLTNLRTAAASAVATEALALPDARVLGIFGTGQVALAHAIALASVRPFREILICGSSKTKADSFATELLSLDLPPARAVTADHCAAEADVLCTCTTSSLPLFDGRLLKPGTHLNLVGAFQPTHREVDTETILRSRVVVDTRQGVLSEAGDLLIPISEGATDEHVVLADLHAVLNDTASVRRNHLDLTLFKSVGCALEDLVAAEVILSHLSRAEFEAVL